ncbi:MAG: bifunctional phosphopantothenoylcysteine decarboxylase/phosphopantothenate--cysteine ligase CoaBC [Candidatus Marinimicrobia bacterium]|nr:bifunctional phosphopantothenoylcysteine decarboxylase/phosphopantothenate--cysteine ligase CoaBC [Candidatus Neomarinimicrobiota bacterium]
MLFENNSLVLGVTGSIAAYKSALLTRQLIKEGAEVRVVMSKAATHFITPLTLNTLTGKDVYIEMFADDNAGTRHIELGKANGILVAPATANLIARVANGIADDLLSAIILASENGKVAFAPAMNVNMYNNPVTQENIAALKEIGYRFIEPEEGELACGDQGTGRLADLEVIVEEFHRYLHGQNRLACKNVVVTAGPTREFLDQVRFISNRSSGKMGYALANEAAKEGASVTLISGPSNLPAPPGVTKISVQSAREMQSSLMDYAGQTDYLFMAAAVEDITPAKRDQSKIKKTSLENSLAIEVNPDLVKNFRENDSKACIVGFSVEFEEGSDRSIEKMKNKGLDFVAWNNPSQKGAGFESDTNQIVLFENDGSRFEFPKAAKRKIAEQLIKTVVEQND